MTIIQARDSRKTASAESGARVRRIVQRPLALTAAVVAFLILLTVLALSRKPGWYAPPVIAPEERQSVRNNLVDAEQAFTESLLNLNTPFTYHLYQNDVNRWIAMRREIYPLIDELAPPVLADPFVVFDDGAITLAGRYRTAGLDVVLSVDVEARYENNTLILKARTVRFGSIPMPIGFGGLGLDRPIERAAGKTWPGSPRMWGDFVNGLHIDAQAWWKNGGVDYRVIGLEITSGRLDLKVEPLGRHTPRKTKDPSDA